MPRSSIQVSSRRRHHRFHVDAGKRGPEAHEVAALGARGRAAAMCATSKLVPPRSQVSTLLSAGFSAIRRRRGYSGRGPEAASQTGCSRAWSTEIAPPPEWQRQHRRFEALALEFVGEVVDPTVRAIAVGIEHGQCGALVLADHRAQLAAARDRHVGQHLAQQREPRGARARD
jgi:hypothetical protein